MSSDDLTDQPMSPAAMRRRRKQEEEEEEMIRESTGDENVSVCIRVRPFNRRELELQKASGEAYVRSVIEMPDGIGGKVVMLRKDDQGQYNVVEEMKFTKSFWSISEEQQPYPFDPITQEDVFETIGVPVLKYAFAGFNNCVFAYGQTGSGKTHTMMGHVECTDGEFGALTGIIPRLCKDLFDRVERKLECAEEGIVKTIDIKLSAIEIYNEQVRDLFWRNKPGRGKTTVLKVRKHPTEGAFVDDLSTMQPKSWEEALKYIDQGTSERTVAATLMNDESSRSHSVFQITLTQSETVHVRSDNPDDRYSKPVTNTRVSKINLVDLAGSERVKKSGAQGQNLKEAATINLSLSTLKKVIETLVANSKEANAKRHVIVPFRESTLTLLLSHSLGGNSKTSMVACASPHHDNQEETLLTLRYASLTRGIVNHTKVNEDDAAKQALALKHKILALQKRLEDGEDEEAEELKDQLELGQDSLKQLERDNVRLERKAKEVQGQTKHEESARFAAAFYNSVKMVMLQQQTDQLEADIAEGERRLLAEQGDVVELQADLDAKDAAAVSTTRRMGKLQAQDNIDALEEVQQDSAHKGLVLDAAEAQKRRDSEIELRYAQKLVNARKLRKAHGANLELLDRLDAAHEVTLTSVIIGAAEMYEQQVREYADADTSLQRDVSLKEAEIPKLIRRREAVEKEAADLQNEARQRDRSHAARMDGVDAAWKRRYGEMKADYEARIRDTEAANYGERREWAEMIDVESVTHEQYAQVAELESTIRTRETAWAGRIAQLCADEADSLDKLVKRTEEEQLQEVASVRHRYELQIGDLYAHLKVVEGIAKDHDVAMAHLRTQCAPLSREFDRLSSAPPPSGDAPPQMHRLHELLKAHAGDYSSTRVSEQSAAPGAEPARPMFGSNLALGSSVGAAPVASQRGRVRMPDVSFFPLHKADGPR
jgi:hypothetical protein